MWADGTLGIEDSPGAKEPAALSSYRILVVDDDPKMLSLMKRGLTFAGYSVDRAADGEEALTLAREQPPDLAVLDVMLPGLDGLEVCRRLRAGEPELPLLMLTARDRVPDRVAGLDAGADDYLVKPFAFDELLARIRALLRRSHPGPDDNLRFADLVVNPATRQVWQRGRAVELTAREYELLEFFLRHPRQVVSRPLILERVWGWTFLGESNVIEVQNLLQMDLAANKRQEAAADAPEEVERMSRLVSDLLFLTEVDMDDAVEHQPVPLHELMSGISQRAVNLDGGQHRIVLAPNQPVTILGDRDRLDQLLWNLVSNALRYTPAGGKIHLSLCDHGQTAEIRVADSGPGIAAEHLPRLFERFYRADKARSRRQGGSGLGLAIVKQVAEAHGGQVSVSSEPGQGSSFAVVLPKAPL